MEGMLASIEKSDEKKKLTPQRIGNLNKKCLGCGHKNKKCTCKQKEK